jgi:hypothetical protein
LIIAAQRGGRILQVGHLERFNPGIIAALGALKRPLYFEVHRLGVFTPRSLDIDVVYDVMIHDLDVLLALVDAPVTSIHALGIPVVTDKVDIAHARLEFASGAVANLTASRVSVERVRKLRFFQAARVHLGGLHPPRCAAHPRKATGAAAEVRVRAISRSAPGAARGRAASLHRCGAGSHHAGGGWGGRPRTLALADQVMAGILEHNQRVQLGDLARPQVGPQIER